VVLSYEILCFWFKPIDAYHKANACLADTLSVSRALASAPLRHAQALVAPYSLDLHVVDVPTLGAGVDMGSTKPTPGIILGPRPQPGAWSGVRAMGSRTTVGLCSLALLLVGWRSPAPRHNPSAANCRALMTRRGRRS
jgi:hypothetical protein